LVDNPANLLYNKDIATKERDMIFSAVVIGTIIAAGEVSEDLNSIKELEESNPSVGRITLAIVVSLSLNAFLFFYF